MLDNINGCLAVRKGNKVPMKPDALSVDHSRFFDAIGKREAGANTANPTNTMRGHDREFYLGPALGNGVHGKRPEFVLLHTRYLSIIPVSHSTPTGLEEWTL
jgi:hypothetical protein